MARKQKMILNVSLRFDLLEQKFKFDDGRFFFYATEKWLEVVKLAI